MLRSFKIGGIHPPGNKISKNSQITTAPLPDQVVVPLSQHIGAPATPCVAKGDHVKVGQLIGQSSGFVSANIHSPISGVVTAIDSLPDGLEYENLPSLSHGKGMNGWKRLIAVIH